MTTKPELDREIAVTGEGIDITRPYVGPLLSPYDPLLSGRGAGDLAIYEQVLSDPEVMACLSQRRLAVTRAEWTVEAGGKAAIDVQAAEFLKTQLQRIGWDSVTTKMHFGVFYGYSVAEVIYGVQDRYIGIDRIKVRNRRRFRFGTKGDLRMLTTQQMFEGVPCEQPYFWNFATGADHDDEPYGMGLAHWLYWPVLFKRQGIKFWLMFLDKMATGTALGKYNPQTTTDTEKAKLLEAVRALAGGALGAIVPDAMAIELLNIAKAGTADYKGVQDHMDAAIQKVILGQTASTQGTPGRLGNDDLQGDVRNDIVKADADLICESFNIGPAKWITEWNFPGAVPPRVYRITEEPEDLGETADRDKKVMDLGFKPSLAYITETYGSHWEEKPQPPPLRRGALPALGGDVAFAEAAEPDVAGRMAQQLTRTTARSGAKWVEQIRQAAERANSLEELREYVLRLAPELSLQEYSDAMAEALAAAQLAGRFEVTQDAP